MVKKLSWPRQNPFQRLRRPYHCSLVEEENSPVAKPVAELSYMGLSRTFADAMKSCGERGAISEARKVHACLISHGLHTLTFLQNHLINMYAKCGSVEDARRVFLAASAPNVFSWNTMITGYCSSGMMDKARQLFDEMPVRDSVSWNTIMSGYVQDGQCENALVLFVSMVRDLCCRPNHFTVSCAMKACGDIQSAELGKQLHGFAAKVNLESDLHVEISLLDMYIKCQSMESASLQFRVMKNPDIFCWNNMILGYSKSAGVGMALKMFHDMPERDKVSWNTIISILSQHGHSIRALSMLFEMQNGGFHPDSVTYSSVLSACAHISDLAWGRHLHARILRLQSCIDVYTGSALVDMYSKCGSLGTAKRVFDCLTNHNAVSWTSLIAGFVQSGFSEEALVLFDKMREECVIADQFTFATILGACCSRKDVGLGGQMHCYSIKFGVDFYLPVSNALLAMYAKCGNIQNSESVFNSMTVKDVISWTSMVTAYSQGDDLHKAIMCFNKMPNRNVVTWNSMLAAYIQHGHREEGIKLFVLMQRDNSVKPDWVTFATILSACADTGALRFGYQIFAQTVKVGLDFDTSVANGIVTMYSKCGRVLEAVEVFCSISKKDLVSWNSMISGYAQNGLGKKAIETFENMLREGAEPDNISYVGVLSGCSHSGLVLEGKCYFDSMTNVHNISPNSEHYACMVDLLGRAGLLGEAKKMIEEMPIEPSVAVWGALLGACRVHGDTELAEHAVEHIIQLDTKDSGSYVLLANIYSDAGKLDNVAAIRKLMRDRGIKKNPGCSWIEANNRIHVFTVGDMNHPLTEDILKTLDEIVKKIESKGYIRTTGSQTHHSEKIAVAFGLFSLPSWVPIHIMKNLRVCNDCHVFLKLTSLVAARELVVRDANRFHHFKEGSCSCGDYW